MKKITRSFLCFALAVLSMPNLALTSSLDGANVTGCCRSSSSIATPMGVNTAATNATAAVNEFTGIQSSIINKNIINTGTAITAEIEKNREAMSGLFKNQNSELSKMFSQFGMAQEELKIQETTGPNARFNNHCLGPEIGAGVQVGKKAEKKLTEELETDSKEYNKFWNNPDSILDYHKAKDLDKISGQLLFPLNKTLTTVELKDAQNIVELIVNPYPELQLPTHVKDKEKVKKYEVLQRQKDASLAIPQLVFNQCLSAFAPTLPLGSQATILNEQMGNDGAPEQVIDGMISPYAFLTLFSDSKFANPNWWAELTTKEIKALQAESLTINAALLEIQNRKLALMQLQTLMAAQESSARTNEIMHPTLNAAYKDIFKN